MKNYVAKLRENEEKGFSLVELIIVMAIMAILVGVVASQVIPYKMCIRDRDIRQSSIGYRLRMNIAWEAYISYTCVPKIRQVPLI